LGFRNTFFFIPISSFVLIPPLCSWFAHGPESVGNRVLPVNGQSRHVAVFRTSRTFKRWALPYLPPPLTVLILCTSNGPFDIFPFDSLFSYSIRDPLRPSSFSMAAQISLFPPSSDLIITSPSSPYLAFYACVLPTCALLLSWSVLPEEPVGFLTSRNPL